MGTRLSGRGELAAGCVAVGMLAFLVLVLRLHLLLAAVLAVATYAGWSLLRMPALSLPVSPWDDIPGPWNRWPANDIREATPEERAYAAAFARAKALRALMARVAKPAVQHQVGLILDRVDRILAAMAEDQDLSQIPLLDSCLLSPLHELLSTYLRLAEREIRSAGDGLKRIESHDLPLILDAVDDFYERLHSGQLTDLATMSELIEFNLESVRAMMRGRVRRDNRDEDRAEDAF